MKKPPFLSTLAAGCGDERFDAPLADEAPVGTAAEALACSTRITYGDRWIRPSNRPAQYDIAADKGWAVVWIGP